ncbi:MAG TPA: PEP-CTERM sorting domain-containing protein [Myxococcales bacterium]|nr:PEP-CTERM sorting domain-containing protein [Myxococcales bacterium]
MHNAFRPAFRQAHPQAPGQALGSALGSAALFVLMFFTASQASAIALSLGGADGQIVATGDQVAITVSLDTEGAVGITLLSVGVLFDNTLLAYNQGASSTSSYLIYHQVTSAKGAVSPGTFMTASSTCGGYAPQGPIPGCSFWVGTTNQVNVDFLATDLIGGTTSATGTSGNFPDLGNNNFGSGGVMATLIFDVIGTSGVANIDISITAPGNVIGLPGGATGTATLAGSGTVVIPEPTTALLVGLGLMGLAVAGRRRA